MYSANVAGKPKLIHIGKYIRMHSIHNQTPGILLCFAIILILHMLYVLNLIIFGFKPIEDKGIFWQWTDRLSVEEITKSIQYTCKWYFKT